MPAPRSGATAQAFVCARLTSGVNRGVVSLPQYAAYHQQQVVDQAFRCGDGAVEKHGGQLVLPAAADPLPNHRGWYRQKRNQQEKKEIGPDENVIGSDQFAEHHTVTRPGEADPKEAQRECEVSRPLASEESEQA